MCHVSPPQVGQSKDTCATGLYTFAEVGTTPRRRTSELGRKAKGRLLKKMESYVDLSMELVANQAVSPGWMVSGSDQFRRTVAGGL